TQDDPSLVVDALGIVPYDPTIDGDHVEGYYWVNVDALSQKNKEATRGAAAGMAAAAPAEPMPARGGLREVEPILKEDATLPDAEKLAVTSRFCYVSAGLVLQPMQGAAAYALMRRAVASQGDTDLPVSQGLRDRIHALVKTWKELKDEAYWTSVARTI